MVSPDRLTSESIALCSIALVCFLGCESAPSAPAPPPPPPTAEERFENFLTTLKRKIDDPSIRDGAAISSFGSAPGAPLTDWTTTVDHEYFEATADAPPKATVTLTTVSTVTVVLPTAKPETDGTRQDRRGSGPKQEGIAEFEALVTPSAPGVATRGTSSIQTLPGEEVTRLDLEYRGDEWVLLTKLDDSNEPFTSSAIRYALRRQ